MTFRNSSEDYLKSILILKREKGNVRSVDIAKYLGVTKPSVSNAMKKLRKDGLISFEKVISLFRKRAGRPRRTCSASIFL